MPSKSSGRWLKEHFSDPYVKRAQQEGYRSRAVYKLQEIEARDKLFKPGMTIVDLGAAPGAWSQWLIKRVKPQGKVIAVDILPMDPISGVEFIQGDFCEETVFNALLDRLTGTTVDWVVSDMAPNTSGNESVDVPKSIYLAELALDFALRVLPQAGLLMKVFEGEGFDGLLSATRAKFASVVIRKPKASRGRSREVYILARSLKK